MDITRLISGIVILMMVIGISSCLDEEPILSTQELYSQNLIDDFTDFEPCDTVFNGRYELYRQLVEGVNDDPEIELMYEFETPAHTMYVYARNYRTSLLNTQDEEYFHGMVVHEKSSGSAAYVLVEDNTGLPNFENSYVIGHSDTYPESFLFATSPERLASSVGSLGENYRVRLTEIENSSILQSFNLKSEGRALDAGGAVLTFAITELEDLDRTRIFDFFDQISSGTYPFDRMAQQNAKFDTQLGLTGRDMGFTTDFIASDLKDDINTKHLEALKILSSAIQSRSIQNLFCHRDKDDWDNIDIRLPVPSPITN